MTYVSVLPALSSPGIGSGLDVNSIVTSLMAIERQPLVQLQTDSSNLQAELSDYGQIQSLVAALQDAAAPLYSQDSFTQTLTSSSDPSSVTATTTSGAVPGFYSVSASALASSQLTVSAAGQFTDSNATVGTGTLTIRLGSWDSGRTVFTPGPGSADVLVTIDSSDNTLAGVQSAINAANAGVNATLVTDASGTRLALQSVNSGLGNGFRVTVADADGTNTDASGLSRLAYDPGGGAAQMLLAQSAANSQATIDGISVASSSNTFSGVIAGVTFTLGNVTTAPVSVSITQNTDAIKTQLGTFVSAYNALNSYLTQQTRYDSTTNTAGPLQGDGIAVGLEAQLQQLISRTTGASTVFSTFSSLGVQLQADGSLALDDATASAALGQLGELTKALSNLDPVVASNDGLAKQVWDWTNDVLSFGGTVPSETQSLQSMIASNQTDQDSLNQRLTLTEQRLRAQYTALDSTVSQANALAQFVTQEFTPSSSTASSTTL